MEDKRSSDRVRIVACRDLPGLRSYLATATKEDVEGAWDLLLMSSLGSRQHRDTEAMFIALIEAGANVHEMFHKMTPIMLCARQGWVDVVSWLVRHGAHLDAVSISDSEHNPHVRSPLHAAAQMGQVSALEKLISLGGSVEVEDENGNTPLFYALQHRPTMEWLLTHGANLNKTNQYGDNLLHHAMWTIAVVSENTPDKRASLVENTCWLIEQGLDPYMKNEKGHTPLKIACDMGEDLQEKMLATIHATSLRSSTHSAPSHRPVPRF